MIFLMLENEIIIMPMDISSH